MHCSSNLNMLIYIYLILSIVGLLVVQRMYGRYRLKVFAKIPGPPSVPFFGNTLLAIDSLEGIFTRLRKFGNDYYPIACLWLLKTPVLFIRNPDDIQTILKSKSNLDKSNIFYRASERAGIGGILTKGGKNWQKRRKMYTPFFHRDNLNSLGEIVSKHTELLIRQITSCGDESIQNVLPVAMKHSIGIICESAMGYELDKIDVQKEEQYRHAFEGVITILVYRIFKPYLTDWIIKFLPMGLKQSRFKKILTDFSNEVIKERQKYHEGSGNPFANDFLRNLENKLNLNDAEDKSSKKMNALDLFIFHKRKGLMDANELHEEVITLISAGYETTGLNLIFTLLLLAENENEQNLARKEVVDFMKQNDNKLTVSDLSQLQYLDRCIKESLRLFPSVPMVGRRLVEDVQIGKYLIPRNTDVLLNIYDLHRDPNIWEEPNKFKPDRFLPESSKDRHLFAYVPFSSGPRNCLGQKFATTQVKLATAHILYNFYLKPIDFTRNVPFDVHITLKPSTEILRVKFIKILQHD